MTRPARRTAGGLAVRALLSLACLGLAGCPGSAERPEVGDPPPALAGVAAPDAIHHAGPVVLVTYTHLRADALGYLGGPRPTPHFDALARRAEFAGTAIAPSSSPPVSAASWILGVDPWHHQLLSHLAGELRSDLPSLGDAFGRRGYRSTIHYRVAQRMHLWGFFRGFDDAVDLDPGLRAVMRHLRGLDGGPELLWIQLHSTDLPWAGSPPLDLADLYPYADPDVPLPGGLRDRARELYVEAVARADEDLGRILKALGQSGQRDRTLLVVSALHGLELGEHGQTLFAHNLGRESIQVPLLVDLPADWQRPLAVADPDWDGTGGPSARRRAEPALRPPVAATRLWSTLVQAIGGDTLLLHPPSLFEADSRPPQSSLYLGNGVNLHSAVFAARHQPWEQILVTSRFAAAEPEYHLALLSLAGVAAPGLTESPRRLFARMRRDFVSALPWSPPGATGEPAVTWHLERWPRVRSTEVVDDEALARRRATQAHAAWQTWLGAEETPSQAREVDRPEAPVGGAILAGPLGP